MGEEVRMSRYHPLAAADDGFSTEDESVHEWEVGLPTADDLTPLSQTLIPPDLASAFSISTEPYRTLLDVNRASQNTVSTLRGGNSQAFSSNINNFKSFADDRPRDPMVVEGDEENLDFLGTDSRKLRKIESAEEADSALRMENSADDPSSRNLKRPRLVWTPQLHKRFVDVVAHLGIKNAVPKTIMQLMNVEGLTRENVASHLQKYRLYLKRMQGLSNEGPSSSDPLFASTPAPQSSHESGSNGHGHGGNGHLPPPVQITMPYAPQMMPMPVYGHMGVPMGNPGGAGGYHGGFESNYYMMQQRDWSGNNYGSVVSYPHVGPNGK